MNVAIAHKDNVVDGGGERVAEALGDALDAPVFSGYVPDDRDTPFIDLFEDRPLARRLIARGGITRQAAYMLMWRRAADRLREFDVVVTSGNEPLWFTPDEDQTLVAYCHHTLRRQHDRVREIDGWAEAAYSIAVETLFEPNIEKPDLFVCNSELVAHRLEHYFGIPEQRIRVVHPPVPVAEYEPGAAPTQDYYFACSRLVEHKRFEELVRAFNDRHDRLVIAGEGDDRERLEAIADENVTFLGYVSEAEKRRRLAEAKAFCFPATNEDFGIAVVEALAAGTPVITVNEGFPAMLVQDRQSGIIYPRGVDGLGDGIDRFENGGVSWSAERIATFADQFGVGRFERELREAVNEARRRTEIEPTWEMPPAQKVIADGGDHDE